MELNFSLNVKARFCSGSKKGKDLMRVSKVEMQKIVGLGDGAVVMLLGEQQKEDSMNSKRTKPR